MATRSPWREDDLPPAQYFARARQRLRDAARELRDRDEDGPSTPAA